MVDGISSIGCIEYEHDKWRVDVAIAGSQKGFMMPTGLVVVALSQRVVNMINERQDPKMTYYDFGSMLKCKCNWLLSIHTSNDTDAWTTNCN